MPFCQKSEYIQILIRKPPWTKTLKNEMHHPDFFWQTISKIYSPLKAAKEKELKTDPDRAISYFPILALHEVQTSNSTAWICRKDKG